MHKAVSFAETLQHAVFERYLDRTYIKVRRQKSSVATCFHVSIYTFVVLFSGIDDLAPFIPVLNEIFHCLLASSIVCHF